MPAKFVGIMHEATNALEASGIRGRVLGVDDLVPDFELENQRGELRNASELYGRGPLAITFYRGFWCPYCNADLRNLNRYAARIEEGGATLIAISPEKPEYSQKIIRTQKLTFDILHDPRNRVAEQFGLRFALGEDLKTLYSDSFNINLKLYHGDDDWTLPVPARFLVRTDGSIAYAEASPDYTQRPDPDDLLATLETL